MRITIERCLMSALIAILVVSSFLLFGCGEKGALTEKQVIEVSYGYLVTKAEQLQGASAKLKKHDISWGFQLAVHKATKEALDEAKSGKQLGESVYMQISEPLSGQPEPLKTLTWTTALKKIARYQGDGLWSVSISDWEWQVNEKTGAVTAQNEEAAKLLEDVTLKIYHNNTYGYYLDYPPSWQITDEDKSNVLIFSGSPNSVHAFLFVGVIEEEEVAAYKDLQGYIEARLSSFQSQYHEFEVTEATPPRIDYTYMLREDAPRHEARHYFVQYGGKVYEIVASAIQPKFESLSILYDPYSSFRFQP